MSVAVGAIKLGILAVRKLWIESVEVVEETDELVHLIVADVKQIHNGQDRGHVFMWGAPSTEAANVLIR